MGFTEKGRMIITLNGTDTNPYLRLGFKMNPFPLIAKAEYGGIDIKLRKLAADPIPDVAHIRKELAGCDPEFIDLCCRNFKKGEIVNFVIYWPKKEDTHNEIDE